MAGENDSTCQGGCLTVWNDCPHPISSQRSLSDDPKEWECTECGTQQIYAPEIFGQTDPGREYLAAAQAVADARVAEATAFLRFKIANKGVTDKHAQAQAIVETQSALDVALAKLELARRNLIAG